MPIFTGPKTLGEESLKEGSIADVPLHASLNVGQKLPIHQNTLGLKEAFPHGFSDKFKDSVPFGGFAFGMPHFSVGAAVGAHFGTAVGAPVGAPVGAQVPAPAADPSLLKDERFVRSHRSHANFPLYRSRSGRTPAMFR